MADRDFSNNFRKRIGCRLVIINFRSGLFVLEVYPYPSLLIRHHKSWDLNTLESQYLKEGFNSL